LSQKLFHEPVSGYSFYVCIANLCVHQQQHWHGSTREREGFLAACDTIVKRVENFLTSN